MSKELAGITRLFISLAVAIASVIGVPLHKRFNSFEYLAIIIRYNHA